MNLQTMVDSRMWDSVRINYEQRNFSGAILDAVLFLGQIIREKTGLESDGVALVGQALGGDSPILRVSKLQNESDISIQKGAESLLRGVYQCIRNPRSHSKYNDSEIDAKKIIVFIDYLIGIVDAARTPFLREEFVRRVFDPSFVLSDRYVDLLLEEIPKNQYADVFFDLYTDKRNGVPEALERFIPKLLDRLPAEDLSRALQAASEELQTTTQENAAIINIRIFKKQWPLLREAARLRIENWLIQSVREGKFSSTENKVIAGAFGTWATTILSHFSLKAEYLNAVASKLGGFEAGSREYVLKYHFSSLKHVAEEPPLLINIIVEKALVREDKDFMTAMNISPPWPHSKWNADVQRAITAIRESKRFPFYFDDDDVPF